MPNAAPPVLLDRNSIVGGAFVFAVALVGGFWGVSNLVFSDLKQDVREIRKELGKLTDKVSDTRAIVLTNKNTLQFLKQDLDEINRRVVSIQIHEIPAMAAAAPAASLRYYKVKNTSDLADFIRKHGAIWGKTPLVLRPVTSTTADFLDAYTAQAEK